MSERINLEQGFSDLFEKSISATGEEELLRIASDHARQYTSMQMRGLQYLKYLSNKCQNENTRIEILTFINDFDAYKRYHHSDEFVMRALDSISMRKMIQQNGISLDLKR